MQRAQRVAVQRGGIVFLPSINTFQFGKGIPQIFQIPQGIGTFPQGFAAAGENEKSGNIFESRGALCYTCLIKSGLLRPDFWRDL